MIPKIPEYMIEAGEPSTLPSYTYKFDPTTKKIAGKVDGLEAVRQAVYLYLHTEVADWDIFPDDDYGIASRDLYGRDPLEVKNLIEGRVKDALSIDTRIMDVLDFSAEVDKTKVIVRFVVQTNEGKVDVEETIPLEAS